MVIGLRGSKNGRFKSGRVKSEDNKSEGVKSEGVKSEGVKSVSDCIKVISGSAFEIVQQCNCPPMQMDLI